MAAPPSQKPHIVVVWGQDWNGALRDTGELIRGWRESGADVTVIGDGKRVLTLDEISQKLREVHGPATLYIAAHGSGNSIMGHHEIFGITYGGGLSGPTVLERPVLQVLYGTGKNSAVTSDALFNLVPSNYIGVIQDSCFAGAAVDAAAEYLPRGTYYFPLASRDQEGYSGSQYIMNASHLLDGRVMHPSDMYFAMLMQTYSANGMGIDKEQLGGKLDARDRTQRLSIPTQIAVGGGIIVDLDKEMKQTAGKKLSDQFLTGFYDRFPSALAWYPDVARGFDFAAENQARATGHEVDYAHSLALTALRRLAEKISKGALHKGDPDYALGLAMMYYQAEREGKFGPVAERTIVNQPLPRSDMPENVFGHKMPTKFERELAGLIPELTAKGWGRLSYKDGTNVIPDVDHDGKLSVADLEQFLKGLGITRAEQLGNHDREITGKEFTDFVVPKVTKPGNYVKPEKPGHTR